MTFHDRSYYEKKGMDAEKMINGQLSTLHARFRCACNPTASHNDPAGLRLEATRQLIEFADCFPEYANQVATILAGIDS